MKKKLLTIASLLVCSLALGQPQFKVGSAELTPEIKGYLNQFHEQSKIYVVYGTADNTGGVKVNLELAQLRAQNATEYLQTHGLTAYSGVLSGLQYPIRTVVVQAIVKAYELQTINRESDTDLSPVNKRLNQLEEQNAQLLNMLANRDTVILTDSSFSANVYVSIGGSGVVNIFDRDPLYGGGAQTQITFPAFNGVMKLFGSFRDEVTTTAGLNYMWQVANPIGAELYAQVGGLYVSYPMVNLSARKWVALAVGTTLTYPIPGVGWITGSLDALPNIELITDPVSKNISFGKLGLSLYPAVSVAFRVN